MVYYDDGGLCLRNMRESDVERFYRAFSALDPGGNKTRSRFEGYFREQTIGKRIMLVAEKDGNPAGYCSLMQSPWDGPFKDKSIPEITDFNVLKTYRRQGIGWQMLDVLEGVASKTSDIVTLSVGLYSDYGAAQRIYARRGYIPDGSGIWYMGKKVTPGQKVRCDDNLVMYLVKRLREER